MQIMWKYTKIKTEQAYCLALLEPFDKAMKCYE
jgi:hypothetical protein